VLQSSLFHSLLLSVFIFALPVSEQSTLAILSINFTGTTSTKGKIMIRLKNNKGEDYKLLSLSADVKPLQLEVKVKPGSYAVAAYHDENNNDKLDKAFTGIPNEKYGFSNNVRGIFGPPDLSDQLVLVQQKNSMVILLE
jgi:uncharacterized protein (DUF2141 family)